jgi:transglutaminase-like putative cysteine protease
MAYSPEGMSQLGHLSDADRSSALSPMKVTRRDALAVGIGLFATPTATFSYDSHIPAPAVTYGSPRTYRITHEATLQVGDGRLLSIEAWLPVPQNHPEQSVSNLQVQPRVPVVRDVTKRASLARFYQTRGLPRTGGHVTYRVSYDVTCRQSMTNWAAVGKPTFDDYKRDATFRLFSRPEKKIETRHAGIKAKAAQLRDGRNEVVETARTIYDFVINSTTYRLLDGIEGAGYCLKNGHGECTEYSALFVALCRSAGIPARPVLGCFGDQTNGWHAWAEFMLPSGEWIPVDASLGDRNPRQREHWFGRLDNRRVVFGKTYDTDLKVGRTKRGRRHVDGLQFGACWFQLTKLQRGGRAPQPQFQIRGRRLDSSTDSK